MPAVIKNSKHDDHGFDADEAFSYLLEIVHSAGNLILKKLRNLDGGGALKMHSKSADCDLVTELDSAVQDYLVGKIKIRYPDAAILAEESDGSNLKKIGDELLATSKSGGGASAAADVLYTWIIDPIDG
jgi:fructose-1,6-bisphosphatase/inositol monophosphatase family enzyme